MDLATNHGQDIDLHMSIVGSVTVVTPAVTRVLGLLNRNWALTLAESSAFLTGDFAINVEKTKPDVMREFGFAMADLNVSIFMHNLE